MVAVHADGVVEEIGTKPKSGHKINQAAHANQVRHDGDEQQQN